MRFIVRRLAFYLLAAWASMTLAFFIPRMMPGDPASAIFARFKGKLQPEALQALRETFGFSDGPLAEQYLNYMGHVLRGDLGLSVSFFPAKVSSVIATGLFWTLWLAGIAVVISFVLGTLLGVLSAWRRGGKLDSLLPPMLVFLGAFPYFWLAMLALFLLGFRLEWFPVRHAYAGHLEPGLRWDFIVSVLRHSVLPAGTIVVATMGGWLLSMRNTMVSVLGEDYTRFAYAKGLSDRRIMFHYAARNALLPNVTGFGMALGFVLSGSLLTEIIFSYPGPVLPPVESPQMFATNRRLSLLSLFATAALVGVVGCGDEETSTTATTSTTASTSSSTGGSGGKHIFDRWHDL